MKFRLPPGGSGAALVFVLVVTASAVERIAIDHGYVASLAEKLATRPYETPDKEVPRFFREINYDTYRDISFRDAATLWRDPGVNFRLQFFHPGYLFTQLVRLNEFTDTHAQTIPFSQGFFDYGKLDVPLLSRWGLEFAGFRILHPLNKPEAWDETISFLGASYYRGLGRHQAYGASARGLAIDATGSGNEEFPAFTEYWLRKPEPGAASLTVHALLDGPSVAGAYTFVITPGDETVVETKATFYFRRAVEKPGFIPVSSMFWFGEDSPSRFGDFRPEVHDSDGLLLAPDPGTRLWRPLRNPAAVSVTDFDTPAFAGFGLLQRDREFRSYEDIEGNYERRPSVWTEPLGTWPAGHVRLLEIPAKDEYHDNVTAFWSPRDKIPPGQAFELAWKQRWTSAPLFGGPPGWVSATRQTLQDGAPDRTKFVIDFDAGSLSHVPGEAVLTPEVTVSAGAEMKHTQIFRNMATGARRLIVVVAAPPGSSPVEIRARILRDQQPVTETWATIWQP
jgi:glucans biosynthesis protein